MLRPRLFKTSPLYLSHFAEFSHSQLSKSPGYLETKGKFYLYILSSHIVFKCLST